MKGIDFNIFRLKELSKKADRFLTLENSEDFINWKAEVVEKRLASYLANVVNAKLDTEEGKISALDNLRNYQQLQFVCKDIFKIWDFTQKEAIKKINETENKSTTE